MRRILFLLVIMLVIVITGGIANKKVQAANNDEIKPMNKPSDSPHSFLGVWTSNGYTLQPNSETYTTPGHKIVLNTKAVKSGWGFMDPSYRWYKSTDAGENWSEVSNYDAGMTKNLHITPKEVGTTYYQQKVDWISSSWWVSSQTAWSRVAAVHAVSQDVPAKKIELSHDHDYLYNIPSELAPNSTLIRADIDPKDYTEDLVWSVDNNDLATIDKETGELFANHNEKSGIVTVTATIDNADGTKVSANTKVAIGGGLMDQITKSGEASKFSLLGIIGRLDIHTKEESEYTIKWFKQPVGTSKKVPVEAFDNKSSILEVTDPKMVNNGDLYWAVINVKTENNNHTYTTNKAKLTVTPADKPDIELNNKVKNNSFDTNNIETFLNQVANGDKLVYETEIINNSDSGSLINGQLVIPIHHGTNIDSVFVDDLELNKDSYSYLDEYDANSSAVVVNKINCLPGQRKHVIVKATVSNISQNETLTSRPTVISKEEDHSYSKEGQIMTINYVTNSLNKNIRDISYGAINAYSKEKVISRTEDTNMPNNIVEIEDQRRVKNPMKIFVSQSSEFTSKKGFVLPGGLRLYNNGQYVDIADNKALVATSGKDESVKSIGWSEQNGLLLYIHGDSIAEGIYSATLNWTFENSI